MFFSDSTLDDLLRRVFQKLLISKHNIAPTRGPATELTGILLQLTNPRARLSRTEIKGKVFSCLGELLWYLAKTKDAKFISYYVQQYERESDDGLTIHGGYGPRLFKMPRETGAVDQVANVLSLLRTNPDSRRAVIQLFDAVDLEKTYKEIPCTCTLQFMIRRRRLNMFTSMRSNDAFFGLPHDVFAFTMLQEIFARSLGVEIGKYKHFVASLHLYKSHWEEAQQFLNEGFQPKVAMPAMPVGNPWTSIRKVLDAERRIRTETVPIDLPALKLDQYWADLVRLLQIYRHYRNGNSKEIVHLKKSMTDRVYDPYIDEKKRTALKRRRTNYPVQMELF